MINVLQPEGSSSTPAVRKTSLLGQDVKALAGLTSRNSCSFYLISLLQPEQVGEFYKKSSFHLVKAVAFDVLNPVPFPVF